MFQFDFIQTDEESYERVISIMAKDYPEAVKKLRGLKLPHFALDEWQVEGVYEHGTIIPNYN